MISESSRIDDFAKAAMQSLMDMEGKFSPIEIMDYLGKPEEAYYDPRVDWPSYVAKRSYDYAAAMMGERRRRASMATVNAGCFPGQG